MKRKIYFDLIAADEFEKVDYGYSIKFDVPKRGEVFITGLEIEYEQTDEKSMRNAFEALYEYMQRYYPGKDYRVQYWVLERIDNGTNDS